MERAHCSTVYRGLPYIGGQPLPATQTPWQRRGSWSSFSLSPRSGSRAVGTRLRGKCRRCISGFVMRSGNPWPLIAPAKKEDVFAFADLCGRQRGQLPKRPAAVTALDQLTLGATSSERLLVRGGRPPKNCNRSELRITVRAPHFLARRAPRPIATYRSERLSPLACAASLIVKATF